MKSIWRKGPLTHVLVEHKFKCLPAELWPWLTEPGRIQRWSLARVQMSQPLACGAERVVTLGLVEHALTKLVERITAVDAPHGFAYSGDPPAHAVEVSLSETFFGTRLSWHARFEPPASWLAVPVAFGMKQQMERSFHKLESLLTGSERERRATPI